MMGLSEEGFNRRSREEIQSDMMSRASNLFGENVNLAENSPLGLFIRLLSYPLALIWFTMEKVYNSAFVDTATGQSLDYVAKYIGITRREASKAVGTVEFTGDDGTTIPEGFLLETADPVIEFETTESVTISGGTAEADIQAVEAGIESNVSSNTITEIVNPIAGLDSVTNPSETTGGQDRETDAELRQRYEESVARGGASTIDSIRASLLELDGVIDAIVEQNNTMDTVDDRPPKSIESFVYGGTDEDIAETIFDTKAGGIQAYGDVELQVEDSMGTDHTIAFTRPDFIDVYVEADITTNGDFPTGGEDEVKTEIIKYIGGTDTDLVEYDGLTLGEDVIRTKIIAAIHNIDGITDVDLQIGDSETSLATSNITIGAKEVAITDDTKVDVI